MKKVTQIARTIVLKLPFGSLSHVRFDFPPFLSSEVIDMKLRINMGLIFLRNSEENKGAIIAIPNTETGKVAPSSFEKRRTHFLLLKPWSAKWKIKTNLLRKVAIFLAPNRHCIHWHCQGLWRKKVQRPITPVLWPRTQRRPSTPAFPLASPKKCRQNPIILTRLWTAARSITEPSSTLLSLLRPASFNPAPDKVHFTLWGNSREACEKREIIHVTTVTPC